MRLPAARESPALLIRLVGAVPLELIASFPPLWSEPPRIGSSEASPAKEAAFVMLLAPILEPDLCSARRTHGIRPCPRM